MRNFWKIRSVQLETQEKNSPSIKDGEEEVFNKEIQESRPGLVLSECLGSLTQGKVNQSEARGKMYDQSEAGQ